MTNTTLSTVSHTRQQRSVLTGIEKRVLGWIAPRLPWSVGSDHLSAIGAAGMALAALSFAAINFTSWASAGVVVGLALNWFGDSLDGTVARFRGHQRPRYGFYVDHVIDLGGTSMLLAGLSASGLMTPLLAFILLSAFLLVSAEVYLATHSSGTFRMSVAGFGPTELRILLAIGAVRASLQPYVSFRDAGPFLLFDVGGVVAAAGLGAAFLFSAARNARALYVLEPLPEANKSRAA